MNRVLLAVAVVAASLIVAWPAAAQSGHRTLEQRVTSSDLIVVGEVAKVDASAKIPKAPGLTAVTITVTKVLKGPDGLKEVTLLWRPPAVAKPPAGPAETPPNDAVNEEKPIAAPPVAANAPVAYEVGQERVWFLKKHFAGETMTVDVSPQQVEPVESAGKVALVVAGLQDPEAALTEGTMAARGLLAAAGVLMERVVPESRLPVVDGKPDPTGARAIDTAAVIAVGNVAVEAFAGADDERALSESILRRLGCPFDTLAPTSEEFARGTKEHRAAWGREVATWIDANLPAMQFYEPAKGAPTKPAETVMRNGRTTRVAEPSAKAAPATAAVGEMKVGAWAPLFAEADWNKFPDDEVREYRGTLIAATNSYRKNLYRLKMADAIWDVYTAGSEAIKPYVGREVTLKGKYMLLLLESRTSREIWPTAIRLDK